MSKALGLGKIISRFRESWQGLPHLTLLDLATDMLQKARERMQPFAQRCTIEVMDMREITFEQPFDLIVSALAIYHLEDAAKQALLRQIYQLLESGGRFVRIEQVLGPTPQIEAFYEQAWLEAVQAKGVSPTDLAAARDVCNKIKRFRC